MVRIFVVKGRHEARPRQKSTVLWMVITTGLQSEQDFGRLVGAYGWGEGLGEGRGGGCLNRDAVVRRTLVSAILRISSRRESKAWEISGFKEAGVLDLNSVP